jgi:hypothetical protein
MLHVDLTEDECVVLRHLLERLSAEVPAAAR